MGTRELCNWSGVHRWRPHDYQEPSSEEQVVGLLARARAEGRVVKVVGGGHSWSDIAATDGVAVRLDRMNRVLELDLERAQITVEGGMRLRELNEHLAVRGLAMPILGSISEQSVAGAIATGTHGSGIGFGNLSAAVRGLRLITAGGELLDVDGTDPELLAAARLHLGCLGVVTRVTLQCEPAFRLRERVIILGFDEAVARVDELVHAGEHVKLWWLPHTDAVRVSTLDRTTEPLSDPGVVVRAAQHLAGLMARRPVDLLTAFDSAVNDRVLTGLMALARRSPGLTPRINAAIGGAYFKPGERVGRSDRVFNLVMPPVHREMEYGIALSDTAAALIGLRALIERERLYINFVVEARFVAADDILMSGSYRRTSCQLGAYIGECASREGYFRGFEALCLGLGGRPHWGKEFEADAAALRAALPGFDRFAAVRRRLDPEGRFANPFVRRLFAEA
ncbi:MAG TPA: D-arabinono-1,4-lactone oxidase [Kofleriaceae bacterium]|nr:D-arabinono-1,4-lactone oxidase [Kofleriaceae bacterium]